MTTSFKRMPWAGAGILLVTSDAIAQVDRPPAASGPTLQGFASDMSAWASSHPGAAVALAIAVVVGIGMVVFNRVSKSR